jgi:hypothetical protein
MGSKRREIRKERAGDVGVAEEQRNEQILEDLQRRFTEFRQMHRPRERIPDQLRDAMLEAIDVGIPEAKVLRACRISREILGRWREVKKGIKRRVRTKGTRARVYPVVEEKLSVPLHHVNAREEQSQLQLQIGSWCISIRQNG